MVRELNMFERAMRGTLPTRGELAAARDEKAKAKKAPAKKAKKKTPKPSKKATKGGTQ